MEGQACARCRQGHDVGQGITPKSASRGVGEVALELTALGERPDFPDELKPMISALQAILAGSRDPALAEDPELGYDDAAEVVLLLESLA